MNRHLLPAGALLSLAACSSGQNVDTMQQVGPNPVLPEPAQGLVASVGVAKVVGWKDGETPDVPAGFKVVLADTGEQMIGSPADSPLRDAEIVTLGAGDVPAMVALTELTKPGPFALRTHELGTFLGIRAGGELVAMTGERMKPGKFVEMTAVCVHPEYRGRGYAQALLAAVARRIEARGEIPFLHVFSNNTSAIALYQRQGMRIRRRLYVTAFMKEG